MHACSLATLECLKPIMATDLHLVEQVSTLMDNSLNEFSDNPIIASYRKNATKLLSECVRYFQASYPTPTFWEKAMHTFGYSHSARERSALKPFLEAQLETIEHLTRAHPQTEQHINRAQCLQPHQIAASYKKIYLLDLLQAIAL